MGAVQPSPHHSLQQHQQQQHQIGAAATAAAVTSMCNQFSLPPPAAALQFSALHNSELGWSWHFEVVIVRKSLCYVCVFF
jgi:hypothetical protein